MCERCWPALQLILKGCFLVTIEPKCNHKHKKRGFDEGGRDGWEGSTSTPGKCILALFSGLHQNRNKEAIFFDGGAGRGQVGLTHPFRRVFLSKILLHYIGKSPLIESLSFPRVEPIPEISPRFDSGCVLGSYNTTDIILNLLPQNSPWLQQSHPSAVNFYLTSTDLSSLLMYFYQINVMTSCNFLAMISHMKMMCYKTLNSCSRVFLKYLSNTKHHSFQWKFILW